MCSFCGAMNSVGKAKVYHCHTCKAIMSRDENGAINIGWNAVLKLMNYIITPKPTIVVPDEKPDDGGDKRRKRDEKEEGDKKVKKTRKKPSSSVKGARSSRVVRKSTRVVSKGGGGGDGGSKQNLHSIVVNQTLANLEENNVKFAP